MDHVVTEPSERPSVESRPSTPERAPGSDRSTASSGKPASPLRVLPTARGYAAKGPLVCAARRPSGGCRHNLPKPLTSFIGREQEIAEARRLLSATRLLTLTGAGGVGKTRLSYEVAGSLLDPPLRPEQAPGAANGHAYRDGVWLVELAALADATQVPLALAAVLGVREEAERPLIATLVDALRTEQLLLVLDNCEHLIEACAELADTLLRACAGLRILATSRQALGIAGETTFRVPSLALSARPATATAPNPRMDSEYNPDAGARPTAESIDRASASEAVHLFVERARAVRPAFRLTDRNAPAVEQICRRLDGIPLAIELAAARVAVLGPEQIAARLGDRFRVLTGGSRTALPRYRTLRALIDWSHDLLDDRERLLLRRLAVFAGGWTLEAAEVVCAGEGLASDEILDLLSGLVAKSLVLTVEQTMEARETRYRFLESPREYAAEKLREAGEETALRGHHFAWFLALAERAERDMFGPRQAAWLRRLDEEHDNLRAALAWSIESGDVESGVRLAASLLLFWLTRGFVGEGQRWLSDLLARSGGSSSDVQARERALRAAGRLAITAGDYDIAHGFLAEAVAIARRHDDLPGIAVGTHGLGFLARKRGDYTAASRLLGEALARFQELGDPKGVADTLLSLGVVAHMQDDLPTARAHHQRSLAAYRALGYQKGIAIALGNLGEIALEQRDLDTARRLEEESLAIARQLGDRERVAYALAALAGVAARQGGARRALRLAGAAMALRESIGGTASAAGRGRFERWLEPARRASSPEALAVAQAEGRAMSLDEAIAYAVAADEPTTGEQMLLLVEPSEAGAVIGGELPDDPAPEQGLSGLTRRELEVAALVARGLTNRQIADTLVITHATASSHVKHILARLEIDSRVQIATWTVERGLHRRAAS